MLGFKSIVSYLWTTGCKSIVQVSKILLHNYIYHGYVTTYITNQLLTRMGPEAF